MPFLKFWLLRLMVLLRKHSNFVKFHYFLGVQKGSKTGPKCSNLGTFHSKIYIKFLKKWFSGPRKVPISRKSSKKRGPLGKEAGFFSSLFRTFSTFSGTRFSLFSKFCKISLFLLPNHTETPKKFRKFAIYSEISTLS